MSDNYPKHGSCQCGNIRYTLIQAPLFIACCHCKECQKLSTSAFSITAMITRESLHINGELSHWQRSSDSGRLNAAKFCGQCGNRIYHYDPSHPELLKFKPSNLDNTSLIRPTKHIWVSQKQDWFTIPEGVEQHLTQPSIKDA